MTAFVNQHLSVSRVRLYEQCPRAFYFRYVDKGPTVERGTPAFFGVVLHAALEMLFKWVVETEYVGPLPVDHLLLCYRKAWAGQQEIVGIGLYEEGLNILRMFAASHPPIDHFSILAVEQQFNVPLETFTLNGFIDRVDKVDDETVQINDYKSNRMLYEGDELRNDLQFAMYGLAARTLYPWAKVIQYRFVMLRHDKVQVASLTAQQIDDAVGYVADIGRSSETDMTWEARTNGNCGYCDHRWRCDKYQSILAGNTPTVVAFDPDDMSGVVEERERCHMLAKVLYARRKELDTMLMKRVREDGPFDTGEYSVKIRASSTTTHRPLTVLRVLREAHVPDERIEEALSVGKGNLEKIVEEEKGFDANKGLLLSVTLDALADKEPGDGYVEVRKNKSFKKRSEKDGNRETE